jgi:glycosyltransferase involved in cell wall biosynthesis
LHNRNVVNQYREASRKKLTQPGESLPDVVIIVVAFNEAERIGDCLNALLNQATDQKYEVVVVDDGSTDGTATIVERLHSADGRLSLIRHPENLGRGAARRTGQNATRAPRIGFVDADIIVPPDWLQLCSSALGENSAVSGVALPDGDAAVMWRIFGPALRFRVGFSGVTGNNVIFDADVLREEPFEAQFTLGEDFRLSHRLLRGGYKLKVLTDLTVEHRESKTYGKAIKYMWDTGIDATSHPFEFRIIRLADISWLVWLAGCLASLLVSAVGAWSWSEGILIALGLTVATSLVYTLSRFRFLPRPLRWIASAFGNLLLISAYLVGRTWGLGVYAVRKRVRNV